jgi:FdhD protein
MDESESLSVKNLSVRKVNGLLSSPASDRLSVEEPLEIRVVSGSRENRILKNVSVTMRTPGHDQDLVLGFLFTEGIIRSYSDVTGICHTDMGCSLQKQNIVQVELAEYCHPPFAQVERNFYTTSSCGVCGKGSIQSIRTSSPFEAVARPGLQLTTEVLYELPAKLEAGQDDFSATGGIHASALFTPEGTLLTMREDVGRHNALDKLIGHAMQRGLLPLTRHILLLSGRASFELIQKAAMAGIGIVAAIGAPSSLAVDLAQEFDITLLGFLKHGRFNIYHLAKNVIIPALYENQN